MLSRVKVRCDWDGHVYYNEKRVQFPKALRTPGKEYVCDLDVQSTNGIVKYYRARPGSICEQQIRRITTVALVNVG